MGVFGVVEGGEVKGGLEEEMALFSFAAAGAGQVVEGIFDWV